MDEDVAAAHTSQQNTGGCIIEEPRCFPGKYVGASEQDTDAIVAQYSQSTIHDVYPRSCPITVFASR